MFKKKINLLIWGQLRTFDQKYVLDSWNKFRDKYEIVTTLVSCWDNRGISQYQKIRNINNLNEIEKIDIKMIEDVYKTKLINLSNVDNFIEEEKNRKIFELYNNNYMLWPTVGGAYLRSKFLKHMEFIDNTYPVVMTRPDVIFLKEPPDYFFNDIDSIWHQQNSISNILYSVYIFSSFKNIKILCDLYHDKNFENLLSKNIEHCYNLFDYVGINNISIKTYNNKDSLFAEPYRGEGLSEIELYRREYMYGNKLWCEND